jgi:hypothetical protein
MRDDRRAEPRHGVAHVTKSLSGSERAVVDQQLPFDVGVR